MSLKSNIMTLNASSQLPENNRDGLYVDEVTKKKIQEHLNNENDVISEQDIANINIGVGNDPDNMTLLDLQDDDSLETTDKDETKEELQEKKVDDNESPAVETPWNILGS